MTNHKWNTLSLIVVILVKFLAEKNKSTQSLDPTHHSVVEPNATQRNARVQRIRDFRDNSAI